MTYLSLSILFAIYIFTSYTGIIAIALGLESALAEMITFYYRLLLVCVLV